MQEQGPFWWGCFRPCAEAAPSDVRNPTIERYWWRKSSRRRESDRDVPGRQEFCRAKRQVDPAGFSPGVHLNYLPGDRGHLSAATIGPAMAASRAAWG